MSPSGPSRPSLSPLGGTHAHTPAPRLRAVPASRPPGRNASAAPGQPSIHSAVPQKIHISVLIPKVGF